MALWLMTGTGHADSLERLIERLDRLEQENRQLRKEIDALKAARQETAPRAAAPASESPAAQFVHVDSEYGYEILDPTTNINRKQRRILDRKKDGTLAPDRLHVQGAITAIANYQLSNRDDKFGYLMRHPTAANQVGDTVSEATIHSAQLGFTGTLGDWLTGHAVMLFDPEQSFGKGTNTDLERNQLQMRRAYVLLGDLDRSPFYASLGKMAVPFGLTDTVSPFTASTVWHAFGGLANGVTVGYVSEGLNVSLMGIQGGAQFRAANTPVEGTGVPSKVNNFAVDAHYGFELGPFAVLCKSWQDGGAVRLDRHRQSVHRLDGLACLWGLGQRGDCGLRERGPERVPHGYPGRGAVSGREYPGGGDWRSEQGEQLRCGRALRFRAGICRHASPGRFLCARCRRCGPYCQDFPVVHFEPCQDNNPAFDVYGKLVYGDFTFKGEFARTTDEWPGTFNPDIPKFAASSFAA